MRKRGWLVLLVSLALFACHSFGSVITIELGSPLDQNGDQYIVDTGWIEVDEHSQIRTEVENYLDPTRYKEWEYQIALPIGSTFSSQILSLEYDTTDGEGTEPADNVDYGNVPLNYLGVENILGVDYDVYYADTTEAAWDAYGTQPIGADWGRIDIGNPEWVNFVVDIPEEVQGSVWISIYDVCEIPEPMTISLLALGGLIIRRKRR